MEETEAYLKANNTEANLTLQINPLKATLDAVQNNWKEPDKAMVHAWLPDCLEMRQSGSLEQLDGWKKKVCFGFKTLPQKWL